MGSDAGTATGTGGGAARTASGDGDGRREGDGGDPARAGAGADADIEGGGGIADGPLGRVPGGRWVPAGAAVALVVATLAAVAVAPGPLAGRAVAGLLPALLAVRLATHARALNPGERGDDLGTVAAWTVGGTAVTGLVVAWFGFLDVVLGLRASPAVAAVTVLAAGALLGTLVGKYSARARRQVEAATRASVREELLRRQGERITLLNRVLGHHTRNAVNVVNLHAEAIKPYVEGQRREHVETIRERSFELSETVDVVREAAETLAELRELGDRDAAAVVRSELADARERFPEAEFGTDLPESAPVRADALLERVVGAQLENAVEHSDREHPSVRVTLEERRADYRLRVADDGPGVPDEHKSLVFEAGDRGETTEGDGLELFLADALVERYGGSIAVEDNDPRGAVFVTTLPKPGTGPPDPGERAADLDTNPARLPV